MLRTPAYAHSPASTLLFAPPNASWAGLEPAGADNIGAAMWDNPAGLVHLRYREFDVGFGRNSGGFDVHTGIFNPGKSVLGLPLAARMDSIKTLIYKEGGTAGEKLTGDATLSSVSLGTGFYLTRRWSVGTAVRAFYVKALDENAVGGAMDIGMIYRPGELVRFSAGIRNIGPDLSLSEKNGDMPVTPLYGIHLTSPARGDISLDFALGMPSGLESFWSAVMSYRLGKFAVVRIGVTDAADVPVIDGQAFGLILKTRWGRFELSQRSTDIANFLRLSWTKRAMKPPAEYPKLLRTPLPKSRSRIQIFRGEAPPEQRRDEPTEEIKPVIQDAGDPAAVAVPAEDEPAAREPDVEADAQDAPAIAVPADRFR